VRDELGFYVPEDAVLHNYRRENIKCCEMWFVWIWGCLPTQMIEIFGAFSLFRQIICHDLVVLWLINTLLELATGSISLAYNRNKSHLLEIYSSAGRLALLSILAPPSSGWQESAS
jgi:hypothetical protein